MFSLNTVTAPLAVHATKLVPSSVLPLAQAACPPQSFINALDTAKFWITLVAATAAVLGLVLVGIGLFFQHNRHDGGQMLKSLMGWMLGAVLVAAAAGIAAVFITVPSGCAKTI